MAVCCSYIPSILILIFFPIFFYFSGPAYSPSSQPERWPRLFTQIRTVVLPQLPRDYNDAIGHAKNSVHHYSLCCANLSTFFRKTGGKKEVAITATAQQVPFKSIIVQSLVDRNLALFLPKSCPVVKGEKKKKVEKVVYSKS